MLERTPARSRLQLESSGAAPGPPLRAHARPARSASLARLVLLVIAAEGLLTLMDALIKSLSARYPTLEIAFLRYVFGLVGAVAYVVWVRPGWPTRETTIHNSLRALLIVVIATSFFFALARLPLADAIALSFISPVLTALLGALVLGERLDWRIARGPCRRPCRHAADRRRQPRQRRRQHRGADRRHRRVASRPSATRSTSSCCATAPRAIRWRRSSCSSTWARR